MTAERPGLLKKHKLSEQELQEKPVICIRLEQPSGIRL
jgi:hypothetical protein